MPNAQDPFSPRLRTLQRNVEAGNAGVADFWQEVTAQGAPLVESVDGDDGYAWVTFLCRAPSDAQNVSVVCELGGRGPISEPMSSLSNTDVWHRTFRARNDVRTSYQLALAGVEQPDPLNPRTNVFAVDAESAFPDGSVLSVLELPSAPPQVWIRPRPGVAAGRMEQYRLRSNLLGNERRTSVYLPPGYSRDGEPCPLVILFDDWIYADVAPTPTILDNLIASGALPPVVAVLLSCVNLETRNRELPCNPAFSDFLVQELMPWVHQRFHVTAQPSRTVLGGASYGGLAAAYAAFRHPDVFGKILSQSGSFGWKPQGDSEYEWLTRQFVASPRLNLSFYLEAGLLETGTDSGADSGAEPSDLIAARHMRDVLLAKGYPVRYSEYNGGHNAVCWQGSLADGLLALLGNEKIS